MFNSLPKLLMVDMIDVYVLDSVIKTLKTYLVQDTCNKLSKKYLGDLGETASLFHKVSGWGIYIVKWSS